MIRKGQILRVNGITISHRLKRGRFDKIVWNGDDWVVIDPENNLSDEIIVKCPNPDKSICHPYGVD